MVPQLRYPGRVRILSLDLASHDGHVACVDGDAVRAIRVVGRVNETELVPLLEDALEEAGWTKTDIEGVACNLGPGGFTSVRNGVAFANALAHGLGVPLAGYHGSALALSRTGAPWWVHSTRRDQAFVLGGPWTEPTLVPVADLPRVDAPVAGDLLDEHRAALAALGASFPAPAPLDAVLPAFLAALDYRTEPLVPWYGRGI